MSGMEQGEPDVTDASQSARRQRKDATDVFIRVGRGLSAGLESRRVLEMLMDGLLEVSGAQRGLIVLFAQGERLESRVCRGIAVWDGEDHESVAGLVVSSIAASGRPLVIEDVSADRRIAHCRDCQPPRSILCYPLWGGGRRTVGAVYVERDGVGGFDEALCGLMEGLADLVSVAIFRSRRQEDELQAIYEHVSTGLVVIDAEGIIHSANRAAATILGRGGLSVESDNCFALMEGQADELRALMHIVVRTGRPASGMILLKDDGERRFVEVETTPLPDDGGELRFLLSLDDQTERHRLLTEAAQREKMAAIGFLAAGVAHEFNNIWSAIYGYAELARQDESFRAELVDVTLEQAERASEIVRSLLSFSDKRLQFRHGVRIGRILKGVVQLVEMELRANAIEVGLDIQADPEVTGSEGQLQQVFLNIVINASHAIRDHGRVDISLTEDDGCAVVRIADSGCGMSEEQLDQIFVPFFTTKGALGGSEQASGHGLGLTLTYNIVAAHAGNITAESTLGEGSAFTIRIPIAGEAPAPTRTPPAPAAASGIPGGPRRFLVVDDEVVLHGLLRTMLRGHTVDAVTHGEQALERLGANRYDLVLLDLVLGGELSGFDVLDRLADAPGAPPIVLITGRHEDKRLPDVAARVAGIVKKPFTMDAIHAALRAALAGPAQHA